MVNRETYRYISENYETLLQQDRRKKSNRNSSRKGQARNRFESGIHYQSTRIGPSLKSLKGGFLKWVSLNGATLLKARHKQPFRVDLLDVMDRLMQRYLH